MQKDDKIFIAGGTGLVGSAILRNLIQKGYTNIIASYHIRKPITSLLPADRWVQVDLINQHEVAEFFKIHKPNIVFMAAAKVGGIVANNKYRADFIYDNLQVQNNVIHQSYCTGVKKLLFLGSTCIYPRDCPQPMKEESLLTDILEYTNEPYAIAKIAGIKMCESYNLQYGTNFISVMPTNLYGWNDNFDLETSHVLPALLRKMHLGKCLEEDNWDGIRKDLDKNPIEKVSGACSQQEIVGILEKYGIRKVPTKGNVEIEIWGSGSPRREFLWSDDMADACVFIMERVNFSDIVAHMNLSTTGGEIRNTHINIGTGKDVSIKELVYLIKDIVGFKGSFYFNTQKPDGTMFKCTDVSKLHALGWKHNVELEEGIERLYKWYVE